MHAAGEDDADERYAVLGNQSGGENRVGAIAGVMTSVPGRIWPTSSFSGACAAIRVELDPRRLDVATPRNLEAQAGGDIDDARRGRTRVGDHRRQHRDRLRVAFDLERSRLGQRHRSTMTMSRVVRTDSTLATTSSISAARCPVRIRSLAWSKTIGSEKDGVSGGDVSHVKHPTRSGRRKKTEAHDTACGARSPLLGNDIRSVRRAASAAIKLSSSAGATTPIGPAPRVIRPALPLCRPLSAEGDTTILGAALARSGCSRVAFGKQKFLYLVGINSACFGNEIGGRDDVAVALAGRIVAKEKRGSDRNGLIELDGHSGSSPDFERVG